MMHLIVEGLTQALTDILYLPKLNFIIFKLTPGILHTIHTFQNKVLKLTAVSPITMSKNFFIMIQ